MNGVRQRAQAADQRGRGRVQQFVAHAEHPSVARGRQVLPLALANHFLQRHAVAGAAPGGDDDVRVYVATVRAMVCLPGSPRNSPPAASTNSATHGCEWISGLPHSSQ